MAAAAAVAVGTMSALVLAQGQGRPASPMGSSAIEIGATMGQDYQRGRWIEVIYGRPILRGRDMFGSGANYGKAANPDAPVWRAGANQSTQLKTEVPLIINGRTVAPGTYTMFVDLKPNNWTLIISSWQAQEKFDENNKTALWGSYNYTPDKDIVRAPMTLETLSRSREQLSWEFVDVSDTGGTLVLAWGRQSASVPFKVG
jgi:hypothetical protein